MENEINGEDSS